MCPECGLKDKVGSQSLQVYPCKDETRGESSSSVLSLLFQALQKLANQYLKREWPESLTEEQTDHR